jgi:16S rRNA (adenine1518-N6/adenine1519-N6)-dimethyltransferase
MDELGRIEAKKSLGQNFLNNPRIPEWMADASNLRSGDFVLEIGPGTGMLTREFLKRGAQVVAVETDARAISVLGESFAEAIGDGRLVLVHADIREVSLTDIGMQCGNYKLIANIPYYLSGHLFRMFLEGSCQPETLVFLTQREVAKRIARDSKESLLSLGVKAYGTPQYVTTVSRGNFTPQPNVDSAIIRVTNISKDNFKNIKEDDFFELLHLGFASKRKQLLGNLSKKWGRDMLLEIFSTLEIREDVRGEDLGLHIWLQLASQLFNTSKSA